MICNRPIHTTTNATKRESSLGVAVSHLLKHGDHAIRIEVAIRKVDIRIDAKLQLPALLRSSRVDSGRSQALQVVRTLIRIHDVNRLMAALERILFVVAVEEGADVTRLVQVGTSKWNGSGGLLHSVSPTGGRVARPS